MTTQTVYFPADMAFTLHAAQYQRILAIIKGLRGDVYGECVRENILYEVARHSSSKASCMSGISMQCINCRMPDERAVHNLIAVLRIDYTVVHGQSPGVYIIQIQQLCKPGMILLETTVLPREMWRLRRPIFDVDSLASNASSLYSWPLAVESNAGDKTLQILCRIYARRFALNVLDGTGPVVVSAIQRAMSLIDKGWIMDEDARGEGKGWIVTRGLVPGPASPARRATNDVCAICHEPLLPSDCVVTLQCKHAFHGFCNAKEQEGGICAWLKDSLTCPFCRCRISA